MPLPIHIACAELNDYGFFASVSRGDDDRVDLMVPDQDVLLTSPQLRGLADALKSLADSLEATKRTEVTMNGLSRQVNGAK